MGGFGRCLVVMVGLMAAPALAQDNPTDEIAVALTDGAPGFSQRGPDGVPVGFNVEAAELLCRRMQVRCSVTLLPLALLMTEVEAGRQHLGFGNLLRTPEREKRFLYSVPYWRSSSIFVGRAALATNNLNDALAGAKVAVQAGSRQERWLTDTHSGRVHALSAPTIAETMGLVASGQADMALVPMLVALHFLKTEAGRDYDFLGEPLVVDGMGGAVHIIVDKRRPDLARRLDTALTGAIRDGSLHAIARRYLPFDIF